MTAGLTRGDARDDLARVERIVRDAARLMTQADRAHLGTRLKTSRRDMVTAYDRAVQDRLVAALAADFPGVGFLCEEGGELSQRDGVRFVIDPIDGTANFVHGTGVSAVSVGLVDGADPVLGVVYDPFSDECYAAAAGHGATRNGVALPQVEDVQLADALVCVGSSPYFPDLYQRTMDLLARRAREFNDIRRDGSAACDCCYVADGRYGLFFEMSLAPWDFAAGALVARECGAWVGTMEGAPLTYADRVSVLAGAPRAAEAFLKGEGH